MKYYIESKKHGPIGNSVLWWGKNSRGYVTELHLAGEYSEEEAKEICSVDHNSMHPVDLVNQIAVKHVRADSLSRLVRGEKKE